MNSVASCCIFISSSLSLSLWYCSYVIWLICSICYVSRLFLCSSNYTPFYLPAYCVTTTKHLDKFMWDNSIFLVVLEYILFILIISHSHSVCIVLYLIICFDHIESLWTRKSAKGGCQGRLDLVTSSLKLLNRYIFLHMCIWMIIIHRRDGF